MAKCYFCDDELIWGNDYSFENYGYEGEGIVSTLTCSNCGADAEFSSKINEK